MPRSPAPHEIVVSRYGVPMTIEVQAQTPDEAAARALDGLRSEPATVLQAVIARRKSP